MAAGRDGTYAYCGRRPRWHRDDNPAMAAYSLKRHEAAACSYGCCGQQQRLDLPLHQQQLVHCDVDGACYIVCVRLHHQQQWLVGYWNIESWFTVLHRRSGQLLGCDEYVLLDRRHQPHFGLLRSQRCVYNRQHGHLELALHPNDCVRAKRSVNIDPHRPHWRSLLSRRLFHRQLRERFDDELDHLLGWQLVLAFDRELPTSADRCERSGNVDDKYRCQLPFRNGGCREWWHWLIDSGRSVVRRRRWRALLHNDARSQFGWYRKYNAAWWNTRRQRIRRHQVCGHLRSTFLRREAWLKHHQ